MSKDSKGGAQRAADDAEKARLEAEEAARTAEAEARAKAEAEAAEAARRAAEEAKPKVFVVAAGKSVTSLRGILVEGTAVEARDFHGGEESFKALVAADVVVTKP
jgi:membrane protein involved in colicin uptake